LTVTVEAGIGFAEVQATLAKAGQFWRSIQLFQSGRRSVALWPQAIQAPFASATTVCEICCWASPLSGRMARSPKLEGRVVKNVAGYDLMKLFTGSYGTLGILTQMTFRVYPLPEASETVVLSGDTIALTQATQPC
jgi:glycolate oxidase FAD binding subunit